MDPDSVALYNQQRLEITSMNPITANQIVLQMVHRIAALVITLALFSAALVTGRRLGARHPLTRLSWAWFGLILVQAGLGIATILSNKAADIATLHVVTGAASLACGGVASIIAFRAAQKHAGQTAQSAASSRGWVGLQTI
jgi:cytochrome c oxidase assembly protein subunit 15